MADNYLEKHREDYETRKAQWLRKKKNLPKLTKRQIPKPEDDAL
jgi:hypothetical protein